MNIDILDCCYHATVITRIESTQGGQGFFDMQKNLIETVIFRYRITALLKGLLWRRRL